MNQFIKRLWSALAWRIKYRYRIWDHWSFVKLCQNGKWLGRPKLTEPQRAFIDRIIELKSIEIVKNRSAPRKKISLVIPHYNQLAFLPHAIESALRQTEPPVEIIVVDDCTADQAGLAELAWAYRNLDLVRILKPDKKLYAGGAREFGRLASVGDLIAYCDADDIMHPQRFEIMAEVFRRFPDAAFVVAGYVPFEGDAPSQEQIKCAELKDSVILPRRLTWALGMKFAKNRLSWIDPATGEVPWYAWGSFGTSSRYPCSLGSPMVTREATSILAWSGPGNHVFTPYEDYEYISLLHATTRAGYQVDLPLLAYRRGSTTNLPAVNSTFIKKQTDTYTGALV